MKRISPEVKAGTEKLERRKRYKIVRYRLGLCVNCGDERGKSTFKRLCTDCGEARKAKRRKKLGSKPWKEGAPGRPPLTVKQEES